MTNQTGKMPSTAEEDRYVSRVEHSAFERNVRSQFDDIRSILVNLGQKIDRSASKGTDWRAVIGALSVFASLMGLALTAVIAVGGIIAWGLNTQLEQRYEVDHLMSESIVNHQREAAAINAQQSEWAAGSEARDSALARELEITLGRFEERLDGIERSRFTGADASKLEDRMDKADRDISVLEALFGIKSSEPGGI